MARHYTYDPEKVTELRMKVVECALAVFNEDPKVKKWSQYKKDLLSRMANRVLPLVNEHQGGEGGQPIPIAIYGGKSIPGHNGNQKDIQAEKKD